MHPDSTFRDIHNYHAYRLYDRMRSYSEKQLESETSTTELVITRNTDRLTLNQQFATQ